MGGMFLGVIVAAILLLIRERPRFSLLIAMAAVVSLVGAIAIMKLDVAKVGCDPQSYVQGHAVWHLLTGLTAYLTYQFLRREKVS